MRHPLVLATALAAELAVGTLALAPPAAAQSTPDNALDPPTAEPIEVDPLGEDPGPVPDDSPDALPAPVRTGRSETLPVEGPSTVPDAAAAVPAIVRSGRLDEPTPTTPDLDSPGPDAPDSKRAVPPSTTTSPRSRTDRPDAAPGTATSPPAATSTPTAPTPTEATPTEATPTAAAANRHVVETGDHLWAIAAEQVAAMTGRPPSDLVAADVVTYWVQLCMQNRPHLRSGNPSLIYPGEVIELPALG